MDLIVLNQQFLFGNLLPFLLLVAGAMELVSGTLLLGRLPTCSQRT
jgi:hypothetical protein